MKERAAGFPRFKAITGHCARYTDEGVHDLKTKSAQNIIDVLTGKGSKYPVNKVG